MPNSNRDANWQQTGPYRGHNAANSDWGCGSVRQADRPARPQRPARRGHGRSAHRDLGRLGGGHRRTRVGCGTGRRRARGCGPHRRRRRLPGDAGPYQHPPPPLPEPHPGLPPRPRRQPVRLAADPVPAVGPPRRGGRPRLGLGGAGRAGPERVHHQHRPPLCASRGRRRPDLRRDRGGCRPGSALPPHPGVDVAQREGRRPAPRLHRADRRRDPGRVRALGGRPPRPVSGRDGAGRAGAVLAVLGVDRADDGHRRSGRATRCAAAHPPGRGHRRGRLLSGDVRDAAGGLLRALWLGHRPVLDRPLRATQSRRGLKAGSLGHRRGPLPQLEHDPGGGAGPGTGAKGRGGAGRSGGGRLGIGRLGLDVDRGPQRHAHGPAARRPGRPGRPLHGAGGAGDGHPGRGRVPGAGRRDR